MESRTTASFLRLWSLLVVLFLYVPLAVIVLYAFNRSNVQTWPIKHFSTRWFSVAWNDQERPDAQQRACGARFHGYRCSNAPRRLAVSR